MEHLDDLSISTLAEKVLGGLSQLDNSDSQEGQHENEGATGEENISPAPVTFLGACLDIGTIPLLWDHEAPSDEARDGLPNTPPGGEEGEQPLLR